MGSAQEEPAEAPSAASRARGWLGAAMAPVTAFKERRAANAELRDRAEVLKMGAAMTLIQSRASVPVRVSLSPDGAMLMWSSSASHQAGMATESGAMALAIVREVKPVPVGGIGGMFRQGATVPLQFMVVADDETVKFEAESETEKERWITSLVDLSKQQVDAKSERKLGHQTRRRMELDDRRREAERRKAEIMKTCGGGGMKHTAAAMMGRA